MIGRRPSHLRAVAVASAVAALALASCSEPPEKLGRPAGRGGSAAGEGCDDAGEGCDGDQDPTATSGGAPSGAGAFGFPVGDRTTFPAGGFRLVQVLGHYFNSGSFVGGHLAEDVAAESEAASRNAPVYSVADGTVLYAGPNGSTYRNVVLIEHALRDGSTVCSFYGHLNAPTVATGASVKRGDPIATILDWSAAFGGDNSHLHYVILSEALCRASAAAKGGLVCGYDDTKGPNGIETIDDAPERYTSVGDVCGTQKYPEAFIAPSKFIAKNHFASAP